jgi:hypothetical protein
MFTSAAGVYSFRTDQTGAGQISATAAGAIVAVVWQLIGLSRSGASIRLYINGLDRTSTAAAHINPLTSVGDCYIGGGAAGTWWNGRLWNPRIWGRALSPSEHMSIFKRERHLFGV